MPAPRNPAQAFYAHLHDVAGAVTKVHGTLYFVTDDDVVEVEPADCTWLTVLGAMTLADAQHIEDLMHGGVVGVALSREMGVR